MEELKEIEVHIEGKVQGVFFRDFVQQRASALALVGCVENTPDGRVNVIAQGGEKELKKLIEHLHSGFSGTSISHVTVTWNKPSKKFSEFSIIY